MTQTIDRFNLEAQIMNCWNIVDDLSMLADRKEGTTENIQALARIYQMKFESLFDTFEKLIAEGKIT
jgi:uncharacterized protein YutE (UPF0331/DUF86 family)